jgi:hypothetical protein
LSFCCSVLAAHCLPSFDHSICPRQDGGRNGQTHLLGCFQIDH